MSTIRFKRNDVGRVFEDTLGIDLTGATVVFVMKDIDSGDVYRLDAVVDAGTNGDVNVTISPGETIPQVVGTYNAEWEITFNDGTVLTVPEGSYHTVEVVADLGEDSA